MTTLSLAMIVKNEAANLPRCLGSVKDLVDEMVIVDTGSTDDTVAIAESFGARIGQFSWTDDFAAARNESLRLCTGDWVLILDGDEAVDALDHPIIREACAQDQVPAFFMTLRNYFKDGGAILLDQVLKPNEGDYDQGSEFSHYADFPGVRLCKRFPDLRFEGRIHELLAPYFQKKHLAVGILEAVIHHFGKVDLAREEEKKVRYLHMAKEQVEAEPHNAQAHFNLMAQAAVARDWPLVITAGLAHLALQPRPPLMVLTTLALAYQETGQPAEAIPHLKRVLLQNPKHPLALTRLPVSFAQTGHSAEALRMLERTIRIYPVLPAPRRALAEIQLSLGQVSEGQATLNQAIAACPSDTSLREKLVKVELQLGHEAQAALVAWAALQSIPHGGGGHWHALVAGFLLKSGETVKGLALLEQGLKLYPTHAGLLGLQSAAAKD